MKGNVSSEEENRCRDWLLGQIDGLHPCTTTCDTVTNAVIKHNKYSVKWEENKSNEQEGSKQENKEGERNPSS